MQLTKEVITEKIELHSQWMKAVENMPKDTPCHAHTNERMAHRADLEQIRDITFPADVRWFPILNTTEREKQELRRVDMEKIALHDLIIVASGVPLTMS